MRDLHTWGIVAVVAAVTAAIRFLPFLIFNGKREAPPIIKKLSRSLPAAVMAMLVVYCLKHVSFSSLSGFLPELIASAIVVVLHVWKRNTLISMLAGIISYMLLVQYVF